MRIIKESLTNEEVMEEVTHKLEELEKEVTRQKEIVGNEKNPEDYKLVISNAVNNISDILVGIIELEMEL